MSNENRRKLALELVKADSENAYFKITEQTHRGTEFAAAGKIFTPKEGVEICSSDCPEYQKTPSMRLYVRGGFSKQDHYRIRIPFSHLQDILEAVAEYNATNGGFDNVFPKDGDTYYYIHMSGGVNQTHYENYFEDKNRIKFGNCFQTRALAETALEKIRELLKTLPKIEVKK